MSSRAVSNVTNDNLNAVYSDGDEYENEILNAVSAPKPEIEVEKLLKQDKWAYRYHLSPDRENLLSWFEFNSNDSLLEVGAGCGALTPLFCQRLKNVVAIEPSARRLEIAKYRCKNFNNIEFLNDNIQNLKIPQKFDYVTSIGVLEYSGNSIRGNNPYTEFVTILKKFLKPDGKLIIAIENKFGLKYWAGAPEDHTGRYFDSIENYPVTDKIKTFSKLELTNLLKEQGLTNIQFYYPTPDYKFPIQIFSDNQLPDSNLGISAYSLPAYHGDHREVLFDEKKATENIVQNKMFDFFANSFLVIAGV